MRTGGDERNRDFAGAAVETTASDELMAVAYDPQTAGGLLISLPADKVAVLAASFRARELFVARIGRVEEGAGVILA